MPKKAVKLCRSGHRQSQKWRDADPCLQCDQAERTKALNDPAAAARERAEKLAELGPMPDELVIRSGDGGAPVTHRVPRHLMPRRKRG